MDARDLTQQTFLIWATKGHQLRESSKAKTWLFTTLHREYLRAKRRLNKFPQQELEAAGEDLPHVQPEGIDLLDGETVVGLLGRVDRIFQAPVALFYLEDYSYQEIADILEVPLGTVKSRIARGMAQLQRQLRRELNPHTTPNKPTP
jgi:RNA polymerase sigma-70 factor (ECF subfamily)